MKKKKIEKAFLPVSKDEMVERGWYYYDFLVVTADAYIDHPSFGTAIIARVLEAKASTLMSLYFLFIFIKSPRVRQLIIFQKNCSVFYFP